MDPRRWLPAPSAPQVRSSRSVCSPGKKLAVVLPGTHNRIDGLCLAGVPVAALLRQPTAAPLPSPLAYQAGRGKAEQVPATAGQVCAVEKKSCLLWKGVFGQPDNARQFLLEVGFGWFLYELHCILQASTSS